MVNTNFEKFTLLNSMGYEIVSTTLKIQHNYVEIFAMTFVNKLTNFLVVYIYDNVHEDVLLFEPEQFI